MRSSLFQNTLRYYENDCPSPDGNGILFLASLARKRYSGQQEKAPSFYYAQGDNSKTTQLEIKI